LAWANNNPEGNMSSSSKNDTSLCDLRKEETMRSNCLKYSVPYVSPDALQTARKLMQSTLATQKKRQQRAARLDEVKKAARIADVNRKRKAKAAQTDEVREAARIANGEQHRKARSAQTDEAREAARIANVNEQRKIQSCPN
jgi:hypothetical protein